MTNDKTIAAYVKAETALRFPTFPVHGQAGTSFKPEHLAAIAAGSGASGVFRSPRRKLHGRRRLAPPMLESVRRDHPISLHGVCMSLGGPQPLSKDHLQRFRDLVRRYEPALVSEHLAWSTHEDTYLNDLLPLPYTARTLAHVCDHVDQMQTVIGRPILLENPSTYLLFAESEMSETDFMREIARRTGCGLLLDINNVFVSATNHGYSALDYLANFRSPRLARSISPAMPNKRTTKATCCSSTAMTDRSPMPSGNSTKPSSIAAARSRP